MEYNKKGQGFEVLGHFVLQDEEGKAVHYSRVKFFRTKHVDVFPTEKVKKGEIEDLSLVTNIVMKPSEGDVEELKKLVKDMPAMVITTLPEVEILETPAVSEPLSETLPQIIATSPLGEETTVEDLKEFCAEHNLDMESVEAVLAGKQRTHRKWRFTIA